MGNCLYLVYFRFCNTQKAAMPMIHATTGIMATSVIISGVSAAWVSSVVVSSFGVNTAAGCIGSIGLGFAVAGEGAVV